MTKTDERHEQQHSYLAALQERVERIEQSAYANAKAHNAHAPRKIAHRASHSQRVSQIAAWRSHLKMHGVDLTSALVSLADMKIMHERLHGDEEGL